MPSTTLLWKSGLFLLAGLALFGQTPKAKQPPQEKRNMTHVSGTFTVKITPLPQTTFLRLQLDKEYQGAMVGTAQGEMIASNGGDQPAGGYIAMERFTGTLDGRQGSFVLQHSGIMSPGKMEIQVLISPGSGTDALTGITGALRIIKDGKTHRYELDYNLPEAPK